MTRDSDTSLNRTQRRYTLDEATTILRAEECGRSGHAYRISEAVGHDGPTGIHCDRCGKVWQVGAELTEHPIIQAAIKCRDNAKARKADLNESGIIYAVNEAGL